MRMLLCALVVVVGLVVVGCAEQGGGPTPAGPANAVASGDAEAVAFAVAWCTDESPETAGRTAAANAVQALGCPAKGLIFYEYYPAKAKDDGREVPDTGKEEKVLPAIRAAAKGVPVIGCRARSLVNGGTMLADTVACLAIGGGKVSCKVAKSQLADDRMAVGASIGSQLEVPDLKLVFALAEMSLSFEAKQGVSVEDFIRGILKEAGEGVTLFGGNCLPNEPTDYPKDWGGAQFIGDEILTGHVVAMGIGGPIAIHANHTNEFALSDETCEVTKVDEKDNKWVLELDGKPCADEYRRIRGMTPDEPFTTDSQHPIGVIVGTDKVYLRMVLDEDKERKALKFVAPVPVGTKVKILIGGYDAQRILDSARDGIAESVRKAGDAKPLLALLSDCCARGGRLRQFRKSEDECEVRQAILPALGDKAGFPIFGFYAWGELGPIAGPFGGLTCMYQQHTFVSAVLTEAK